MEKNNVPALLTHYVHGIKNQRFYEPFKDMVEDGEAIVKVTLKNRALTMEATGTFETELKVAESQIASLKENYRNAQTELDAAKATVKAQEKEIAKLKEAVDDAEAEVKRVKAEAKKKATTKKTKVVKTSIPKGFY